MDVMALKGVTGKTVMSGVKAQKASPGLLVKQGMKQTLDSLVRKGMTGVKAALGIAGLLDLSGATVTKVVVGSQDLLAMKTPRAMPVLLVRCSVRVYCSALLR
ncbi:hypothetical protein D3C85_349810 [compost metagenome]